MGETALARLRAMTSGYSQSRAIQVMADLGLADLIARGVDNLDGLVAETGLHRRNLLRFLRYLTGSGLLEVKDERFSLTEMGSLLRSDVEGSQYYTIRLWSHLYAAYNELETVLRSNSPAYDAHYGRSIFDRMRQDPEIDHIYNMAMEQLHSGVSEAVAEAYNFAGIDRILDVGGGNGSTMIALLSRYPHLTGAVFDQPHVIEKTKKTLEELGLSQRCATIEGSFFEELPGGFQTILMRNILHDWPDEEATQILTNCRKAVGKGGQILIVETLGGTSEMTPQQLRIDLSMMVVHAGEERTEEAFLPIFEAAGVELQGIVATGSLFSVIETQAVS